MSSLAYTDRGAGPALVLVHGFPLDSRMWEAQVAELSPKFRVIAPDLKGFGKSSSQEPFTVKSQADQVHALLTELGALPCVLAGLSMGGYIALAYSRKYASDLRGIVLVDTKASADSGQQREGRQKMIDLVRSTGAGAVADEMLPKLLAADSPRLRPAVAQAVRKMIEQCPPLTIEHALVALRDRPDQSEHLPNIRVPALIVVGDHDAITPISDAQLMKERMSGAELSVIRGAGHLSPMEQPAQVNMALGRFLQRLPRIR